MRTFETEKCGDECLTTYERGYESDGESRSRDSTARALWLFRPGPFDGISPMRTERDVFAATIF